MSGMPVSAACGPCAIGRLQPMKGRSAALYIEGFYIMREDVQARAREGGRYWTPVSGGAHTGHV